MVDSWRVTGVTEDPFFAADLPGLDGAHVARYRQCAPKTGTLFSGFPFDVDFRVVGNGQGSVDAALAQGILRLGTIWRFWLTDTHTVTILEKSCYFCGTLARDTDPIIRVRMRGDYLAEIRAHAPVFESNMGIPETEVPVRRPAARVRMISEYRS